MAREINNTINDEHCKLMQFLLEMWVRENMWFLLRMVYKGNKIQNLKGARGIFSDGKKNMLNWKGKGISF